MGKYDSPRKSQPGRTSHAQPARLPYVPTVRRSALEEDAWKNGSQAKTEPGLGDAWDHAFDGLEDEPLPVPDLAPEEETQIVARKVIMPPIPEAARKQKVIDPLAMLEAATIRATPRTRG